MLWYINTCDSHETFGPFETHDKAYLWARGRKLGSFSINKEPAWTIVQTNI